VNEKDKFIEECTGPCDWDSLLLKRFEEYVDDDSIVVDVGANHGIFSFGLKNMKEIYAIEPDIQNFNILKSKSSSKFNIKLINAAISDYVGKIDIYDGNGDHATRSIFSNNTKKISTVDCATLDYIFLKKLKIQPNVCKIDTEGAESLVFKGGMNTIKNMNVLFVEIHNETTYKDIVGICLREKWKVSCLKNLHQINTLDELNFCYQLIIQPKKI
jgi:FkbM family methyltransferase